MRVLVVVSFWYKPRVNLPGEINMERSKKLILVPPMFRVRSFKTCFSKVFRIRAVRSIVRRLINSDNVP